MDRSEKLMVAASAGLTLLVGGILIAQARGLNSRTVRSGTVAGALVDRLDRWVQHKFRTAEGVFGMSRTASGPHNVWSQEPEAKALAAEFQRLGINAQFRAVALKRGDKTWGTPVQPVYEAKARKGDYSVRFASRKEAEAALKSNKSDYVGLRAVGEPEYHQSVSEVMPVRTTYRGPFSVASLPELRKGIQESITALQKSRSHTFKAGDWEVVARPIVASDKKCLSCHWGPDGSPARLNDTLGLALYAFKKEAPGEKVALAVR